MRRIDCDRDMPHALAACATMRIAVCDETAAKNAPLSETRRDDLRRKMGARSTRKRSVKCNAGVKGSEWKPVF
jgi:hypothetical protein